MHCCDAKNLCLAQVTMNLSCSPSILNFLELAFTKVALFLKQHVITEKKLIELALQMLYESAVNYTTPNKGYNGNVVSLMLYESGVDYTTPNEGYNGNVWYYKWQSHS